MEAVHDLHKLGISHNNLNNKSILITSATFDLKLANFDLVSDLDEVPPFLNEITSEYNKDFFAQSIFDFRLTDVFNLGQIIFQLITGVLPFTCYFCEKTNLIKVDENCQFYKLLQLQKYDQYWAQVDPKNKLTSEFKHFTQEMIQQSKEVTLDQILEHPWLK